MRKKISIISALCLLLALFATPGQAVYAAGVSLSLSSSSVEIGDSVTATVQVPSGYSATVSLSYPSDLLEYTSSSVTSNQNSGTVTMTLGGVTSQSATVSFKAKSAGSQSLSVSVIKAGSDETGDLVTLDGASAKITVANAASGNSGSTGSNNSNGNNSSTGSNAGEDVETQKQSSDNSLASLKLSAGTLSPAFAYNITNYKAEVDHSVTSIAISATPSNAKATIESVTGNEKLAVGKNTIKIVVKAENGIKAEYTIVVTRKSEERTDEEENSEDAGEEEDTEQVDEQQESFEINGRLLFPAESIPQEEYPSDFSLLPVRVGEKEYPGLSFDHGDVTLLYLINENGEGSFYVYDSIQNAVYPFVRLNSEKGYVIVLLPEAELVPEGYEEQSLSIEGKGTVTAYRNGKAVSSPSDENTSDPESPDNTEGESFGLLDLFLPEQVLAAEPDSADFYLLYGINHLGECGWYQYDTLEGTYQRIAVEGISEDNSLAADGNAQETSAQLQKELQLQKILNRVLIVIFAAIILVIVIINIVLWRRRAKDTEEDEDLEFLDID